ncbi:MAG: hypothetical protein RL660_598 [Bacteroidota bacterium]|jgi:glycosyltransferase involved in cell wall biosynthesis
MRIAIVANTSWNILNFRLGLIRHFISLGHEVFVVAPIDDTSKTLSENCEARIIPIQHLLRKGKNPLKDIRLMRELRHIYKKNQIDVAFQFTIKPNVYGSLAARTLPTKTVSNVTGLGYVFLNKSPVNLLVQRLFKYALSHSDKVVFQNSQDLDEVVALGIVADSKSLIIDGSGINVDVFAPRVSEANTHEHFIFLFIGRLLHDKGVIELVEAFNMLCVDYKHVELRMIGALDIGNPSAISETLLKQWLYRNQQIRYLGLSNDLPSIINDVDCVVLPSYREGLPKSILEAMSMSKPIIVSDAPGCRQLVDNGRNGIICEAKSAIALYKAMREMVQLPQGIRSEMGTHGRHLAVNKYNEKIIVAKYEALLNTMM